MKVESALKQGLNQIGRHWEAGEFDSALAVVDHLLDLSPANPALLVKRAQLIQLLILADDAPSIDSARACLNLAAQLDDQSPVPLIERAYFTYSILDDDTAAEKQFRRAIAVCRNLLREALAGRAKALADLNRDAEAFACLAEARAIPGDAAPTDDQLLADFRLLLQPTN
jgi:tetratricopeptide (TPR) repeat protein